MTNKVTISGQKKCPKIISNDAASKNRVGFDWVILSWSTFLWPKTSKNPGVATRFHFERLGVNNGSV
jgi:hypothetical protein